MPESQSDKEYGKEAGRLVLGIDTCGPSGSVALARVQGHTARFLGETALAGRSYSATLVSAVGDLLAGQGVKLAEVGAIVVVNGPGSFTGVRVGLSAVKGLAEPARIPVIAVSRLAVLAAKAGVGSAALDAHRHEAFLRVEGIDGRVQELLAGAEELAALGKPGRVAVCDDAAAELLTSAWTGAEMVRSEAPTAADAIRLCVPKILAGESADLELLDGHYLRRSDAEIFGAAPNVPHREVPARNVRKMEASDVDQVMEIAARTEHAPRWKREAYTAALDPANQPRRIALVAEDRLAGGLAGFAVASLTPPEAELESIVTAIPHQRRGVARELFGLLKTELRRQGAQEVLLEVRAGNHAALGFYRFLGFQEAGRRTGYYADPVEDAILMKLKLM